MGNRSMLALGLFAAAAVAAALLLPPRAQPDADAEAPHSEAASEGEARDEPAVSASATPKRDCFGDPLPPGAVARLGTLRFKAGMLYDLAYSPDGKWIALAGSGPTALMDVKTGLIAKYVGDKKDFVQAVAFSPDGRRLAIAIPSSLVLWDLAGEEAVWRTKAAEPYLFALAWSPDGRRIAVARRSNSDQLQVFDTQSGSLAYDLSLGEKGLLAVAWSPDGNTLAAAGVDKCVYLVHAASGRKAGELRGHTLQVFGLSFSPDGKHLASAPSVVPGDSDLNDSIRIWDPRSMTQTKTVPCHPVFIRTPAYSPDGRHLAWLEPSKRRIQIWALDHDQLVRTIPNGVPNDRLRFAPDGSALAAAGGNSELRLIDPWTGRRLNPPSGPDSSIDALAVSPDGARIATTDWSNGSAQIWETATGKPILRLPPHEPCGQKVAWSPDRKLLAVVSSDRDGNEHRVRIWDAATGRALRDWKPHDVPVSALCFTSKGTRLITAGWRNHVGEEPRDLPIRIWDVATGKELRRLEGHKLPVASLAVSPDDRRLAAFSYDDGLRVWDLDAGKITHEIKEEHFNINDLVFHPDSDTLVYQQHSLEPGPHVWDLATDRRKWFLRGAWKPHDYRKGLRLLKPHGLIACVENDDGLHIWSIQQERKLFTIPDLGYANIEFTPDGHNAITWQLDATALVWDLSHFLKGAAKDERPDF